MKPNLQYSENGLAEQVYIAAQHIEQVKDTKSQSIVLFGDLFAYIFAKDKSNTSKVELAIQENLNTRKQYLDLLEQYHFSISGHQAAASTEDNLTQRFGEGFALKFKVSKKHNDQIYVILMIEHSAEHHQEGDIILHCHFNDQVKRIRFPSLIDGKSQIILEADALEFQLLSNQNTKIFLL